MNELALQNAIQISSNCFKKQLNASITFVIGFEFPFLHFNFVPKVNSNIVTEELKYLILSFYCHGYECSDSGRLLNSLHRIYCGHTLS